MSATPGGAHPPGSAQPIPTATLFAYASLGEALEVANDVINREVCVCEIRILRPDPPIPARGRVKAHEGDPLGIAKAPVAWVVLPLVALT